MDGVFKITETRIPGLSVIECKVIGDDRGSLERLFCSDELRSVIPDKQIVQINHTRTHRRGTVRGLHFQYPPHAEVKFVTCLRGEVFDVAVDLRQQSPTFLQWHGEILSDTNHKTKVIPEGFAHGVQTLDDDVELLYFHTAAYRPEAEGALNALDPLLNIHWPTEVTERSVRDAGRALLTPHFRGLLV